MKAQLTSDNHLLFWCPGCGEAHGITVDGSRGWWWNGSIESPTITPSILVRFTLYGPDKLPFLKYKGPMPCEASSGVCHSFVTDGQIRFLSDCTHSLAGQTVDLPVWDAHADA